ncbi:MAG: hypothetical protein HFJ50_09630 [Clostridia bacterium]|jgi:stage III sporulation protein AF|nr:hypothetical protein [Clostridia bacterium]
MINYISSWAGGIITAVIVVTILEMILPKGNSKKYIKTIIGIYVIYIIISPAIKLTGGKELKINVKDYEKYFGIEETDINTINVMSVEESYKIELNKKLKADIEEMGYIVHKANAELDLEKGNITKVSLEVEKGKKKEEKNIDISVNKVEVRRGK